MTLLEIERTLRGVLNHFDRYEQLAVQLPWIEIQEEHVDWFHKYPCGILISVFRFPEGYVENHFLSAYVRCVLSRTADAEEWDPDFWKISREERLACIRNSETHGVSVYRQNFVFQELRMQPITAHELEKTIRDYAKQNRIEDHEIQKYTTLLHNAACMELGGCYAGDHTYLAVKEDVMLFIDCGIWD